MTPITAFAEEVRIRSSRAFQGDPIVRYSDSMKINAISLERRSDEELEAMGRTHSDAAMREHALFQLIIRKGQGALALAEEAVFGDPDASLRINVLWALEDIVGDGAKRFGIALANDSNARVREWARVFCWEKQWLDEDFRTARECKYYEGKTFDEVLLLHIQAHLYVRLQSSNDLWGHIVLSPQMLARIYGQAHACPVSETRERELVIAKTLQGLHEDGSDHYESFLFRGFTDRTSALSGNFYFEASTPRPFYKSGRADDPSQGVVEDVVIPFAREGQWFLNPHLQIRQKPAIEYVRGLFQGWAYVNLDQVVADGGDLLVPGNSVLGTLHHPEVGDMTNTFLSGSFKGKLQDWDGDGMLDFNYLPAYATRKGEVDSNLDNVPDVPGRSMCARPLQKKVAQ
jgi:hypothetical protein